MKQIILAIFLCLLSVGKSSLLAQNYLDKSQDHRIKIKVETTKGDFIIELFNSTPIHRDNFIKNVKAHAYDGVLFHRVIRHFVIQAGNPYSKNLPADSSLREENSKSPLKSEITPQKYIHIRGAVGAARMPDNVNPERKSSPMQFYIVTGQYCTSDDLDDYEAENHVHYTNEQRQEYLKRGGTPQLDGAYTVFGQLIDGWDTIDDIQNVKVGTNDRPLKNVVIKRMIILPDTNTKK